MVPFLKAVSAWFMRLFGWLEPTLESPRPATLRISGALYDRVRTLVRPGLRLEPLALVHVRYAAENARNALVAVGAEAFPAHAYVVGPDGANFDVRWLFERANHLVAGNAGVMLAHMHMHKGKPGFSGIDRRTNVTIISRLVSPESTVPCGALVLSLDDCTAFVAGEEREVSVTVLPRYHEGGVYA